MKKLLVTGFEPFGGESINPSWEAVSRLPEAIGEYELTKLLVPVVFDTATSTVLSVAENLRPDAILCIGQAGGRTAITPEMVGINLRYATIPDNNGNQPKDTPCIADGKNAYFATIPVRKISEAIQKQGIPSQVSYSAGAYVCNDLLYTLLHRFENSQTKVGFIHIPYSTEQNKQPSMDLDKIINGLTIAIETL